MMDYTEKCVMVASFAVFFPTVIMGYLLGATSEKPSLEECAKAHNVYKCEWVAMPVGNLEMPE